MPVFSQEHFEKFCESLRIDSKEQGQIPLRWLGTQRYFVNEIAKGLEKGIHNFIILKARQEGISTISLALTLYWLFAHKGLQGALVTDSDDNKTKFRATLQMYIRSMAPGWRVKGGIETHNRSELILANRSRLGYFVAGKKKGSDLGRASSANYLHATEISSWGDEEGFKSFVSTLAETNPNRLYVWESTARGYNHFYEMWEAAKQSVTQKAIFIGWWRNELYQIDRSDPRYKTYWDGAPTSDEQVWLAEIMELYNVSLTDKQIAWWRWKMAEDIKDETTMHQEYPATEQYAFQLTGSKFFSVERVNAAFSRAQVQSPQHFRYKFGMHFEQTQFLDTNHQNSELQIWQPPEENGVYVLGADPAYGSSEWADQFAIQVLRCFSDRVVQVAQYATDDITEQQFAWIIAHIAGSYDPCMVIMEMLGPGGAVFNELQNIKRYAGPRTAANKNLYDVIGKQRDYLWRKPDSVFGGLSFQWQTNSKEKLRMMSTFRSYFEREMIEVNAPECVSQFRHIRRDGDKIGGEGRAKDDLVIALGIAVIGWNDWIRREMEAANRTYAIETRPRDAPRLLNPAEKAVFQFFRSRNLQMPRQ
jgi:hypothetical protein